jgi:hypothetical protein
MPPQVDCDIEDPAANALNELCLLVRRRLEMQAAQRTGLGIARNIGLRDPHLHPGLGERFLAERTREHSALIGKSIELDEKHAVDLGGLEAQIS